nr:MAG: internal scaffolding protein [Microvirus sp.]
MRFRSRYDYLQNIIDKMNEEELEEYNATVEYISKPMVSTFDDDPITQQQFKNECDINYIVNRYLQTGYINPMLVKNGQPVFGDVSTIEGYKQSLDKIKESEQMFMQLPAKIRDRFEHDPLKLLQFVADNNNYEEAVRLGLVEPSAHLPLDVNVPTDTKQGE